MRSSAPCRGASGLVSAPCPSTRGWLAGRCRADAGRRRDAVHAVSLWLCPQSHSCRVRPRERSWPSPCALQPSTRRACPRSLAPAHVSSPLQRCRHRVRWSLLFPAGSRHRPVMPWHLSSCAEQTLSLAVERVRGEGGVTRVMRQPGSAIGPVTTLHEHHPPLVADCRIERSPTRRCCPACSPVLSSPLPPLHVAHLAKQTGPDLHQPRQL